MQYEIEALLRVVLSKPRNLYASGSDEFAEHRAVYAQLVQALMAGNHEFCIYEARPGREQDLPRAPGDGPRYVYHANTPTPGDYCLKRGPLPYLWYMDADGYSGWSTIARDPDLQARSLQFDPVAARRILADYQAKLRGDDYALIPQPDARLEPQIAALDDYVFYPLQVNNDAVLELTDCPQFDLIRQAGAQAQQQGRHLVLKRHPLCQSDTVAAAIGDVIDSDYVHLSTGPTTDLIAGAGAVMLTNSSVGVQALVLDVPVFTFGQSEYGHLTTQLAHPHDTRRVFEDRPARPHDAFAGGIAYLLSEYMVDMRNSDQVAARIATHIADCADLPQTATPDAAPAQTQDHLLQLTLERALTRQAADLLDFVLMTYGDLAGDTKTTVARMLARLARTGFATEKIMRYTDADVSNRCLKYLDQKGDTAALIRVAQARVQTAPDDWRAHFALARAYKGQGEETAGLAAAAAAAACPGAPSSVQLYDVRSRWSHQGAPDPTIVATVRDVLRAEPENATAHWLQARLYLHDGDAAAARPHSQAALAAQPKDVRFINMQAKIDKLDPIAQGPT